MKKRLCAAFAALTTLAGAPAQAEYWDVIGFQMTGKCTFDKYLAIVKDFNVWGADYGYQARVGMPLQADDLATYYWVGSAENAAAFGAAWDAWRDGLADPKSDSAKLWARFQECTTNVSRTGFDVYGE